MRHPGDGQPHRNRAMPRLTRRALSCARALTPPLVWEAARRRFARHRHDRIRFEGDYASWAEALEEAGSYDAPAILERTIEATRKVRRGEAAFERDGVVFTEPEVNYPLACALLRSAARHQRLHVLDFGGALGCTYDQLRPLLPVGLPVRWAIVEQPAHVAAGRHEFASGEISFHESIAAAGGAAGFDVLLLSGVLQCLPNPFGFVEDVAAMGFDTVVLDRTSFLTGGRSRLTVQRVPAAIYPASYPAWFLADDVMGPLLRLYVVVARWRALDDHHPEDGRAEWRGYLLERRPASSAAVT
jgi:putative methyltransferase (TIGR04325 family)